MMFVPQCPALRCQVDMVERASIQLDLSVGNFRLDGRPSDDDEDNNCICGKECLAPQQDRVEDMLDCDTCHKWFHLKCFGITNAQALRKWNCDTCTVRSATATIMEQLRVRQQTASAKAKAAAAEEQQRLEDERKFSARTAKKKKAAQKPVPDTTTTTTTVRRSKRSRKSAKLTVRDLDSDEEEEEEEKEEEEQTAAAAAEDGLADSGGGTFTATKDTDLKRQLLLNYVTDLGRADPTYQHLRAFYLDKWACIDANNNNNSRAGDAVVVGARCGLFSDPDLQRDVPVQAPGTVDAAVLSPLKSFILSRDLGLAELAVGLSFDTLASVLLDAFMEATSQTIRAAATKAIASVAHIDPEMLARPQFKWFISQTLNDQSASVRHNIVKALGDCIASTTTALSSTGGGDEHVEHLLKKLSDSGVSVRKSVVKILHLLLMRRRQHPQRVQIIRRLLQRYDKLEQEQSVKDVILDCIAQLWFRQTLRAGGGGGKQTSQQEQQDFVEPILAKVSENPSIVVLVCGASCALVTVCACACVWAVFIHATAPWA